MTTEKLSAADEKEARKEALKVRKAEIDAKELKLNEGRTGKGTRIAIGLTKGRNPQMVEYEAFDDTKAETLPTSIDEFMTLASLTDKDEAKIVSFMIDGFNSFQYDAATDPTKEYVDLAWSDDVQLRFRLAVKNYSEATGVSIEDSVTLMKPGFVAAHNATLAKAAAAQ